MSEPIAQPAPAPAAPPPPADEVPVKPGTGMPPMSDADVRALEIKNDRALANVGQDPFMSVAAFTHWMNVAKVFANSAWVPKHLQGRPDDCLIAINLAKRMGEDPLMVMQNTHAIGGKPAFMTAFMVARANTKAKLKSRIRWRHEQLTPPTLKTKQSYEMPNLKVTAYAADENGELCEASVTTAMAIAEDWPKNDKYKSMPEHMLQWRSAAFLIRKYWPEVLMGMQTLEELATMPSPETLGPPPNAITAAEILGGPVIEGTATVVPTPEPAAEGTATTATDATTTTTAAPDATPGREPGSDDDQPNPPKPPAQGTLLK